MVYDTGREKGNEVSIHADHAEEDHHTVSGLTSRESFTYRAKKGVKGVVLTHMAGKPGKWPESVNIQDPATGKKYHVVIDSIAKVDGKPFTPNAPLRAKTWAASWLPYGRRPRAGSSRRGASSVIRVWCPVSRRILRQGFQEHRAECRPLAYGADARGPLKVARDAAHQVDACARHPSKHARSHFH